MSNSLIDRIYGILKKNHYIGSLLSASLTNSGLHRLFLNSLSMNGYIPLAKLVYDVR
jgi:Na+-transporting NADH:ubiquinone oxidoreductase subunit NqrC